MPVTEFDFWLNVAFCLVVMPLFWWALDWALWCIFQVDLEGERS